MGQHLGRGEYRLKFNPLISIVNIVCSGSALDAGEGGLVWSRACLVSGVGSQPGVFPSPALITSEAA